MESDGSRVGVSIVVIGVGLVVVGRNISTFSGFFRAALGRQSWAAKEARSQMPVAGGPLAMLVGQWVSKAFCSRMRVIWKVLMGGMGILPGLGGREVFVLAGGSVRFAMSTLVVTTSLPGMLGVMLSLL